MGEDLDKLKEDSKHRIVSYMCWSGRHIAYVRNWIHDFYVSRFTMSPLLVIRIRKDARMDQAVFDVDHNTLTLNWGNETYDIEPGAIVRNRGSHVMYVCEGIRKPIDMFAWARACEKIATEKNAELGEDELKRYGKIELDAKTAWLKMNNKDAALLSDSASLIHSRNAMYFSAAALAICILLLAQSFGYLPSKMGYQMDYIIQTGSQLLDYYGIPIN